MPRKKTINIDDGLSNAMSLFWARGFRATSMHDLAEYMGISRSSIYGTFGDKSTLFAKALHHYAEVSRGDASLDLAGPSSPSRVIMDLFEACIPAAGKGGSPNGCLLINTALELAPLDGEVAALVDESFTEMEVFFRAAIERGKAIEEIPEAVDADETARALLSLFIGLRVLVRTRPEEPLLRSIVHQVETLLHYAGTA